jgi:hypothetical protein
MQVTVTISDEIVRQAADNGQNIVEYVESLIDGGQRAQSEPALQSAIAHIRALRAEVTTMPESSEPNSDSGSESWTLPKGH